MTKALFHLRQFRLLLLVLLCALFSLPLSAQEAYVVQTIDKNTLIFCYDAYRVKRWGKTWGIDEKSSRSEPAWAGTDESPNNVVTKVEFDDSFKNYRPITTKSWFSYLKALTIIVGLQNLNTSAVTDMTRMFEGCSSLTYLNVFKFNTSSVTNMSEMFSGCSGLKELNVSNFNTSKVTDMNQMFYNCSGLKTIINPNIWRCEQSQDMFKGCTQLNGAVKYDGSKVDVTMANFETGYFRNPNPKAYVQLSEDEHTLTFFYDAYRKWRSGTTWDIDKKSNEISWKSTPIWAGTYESPNNVITKVVFDASFKDFRPSTTENWFYNLSALTTIKGLENLNTSAVTDMRNMFYNCSDLEELNVSNFNTSAVTDMRNMFYNCSDLKELNVSNFNTSAVTDMSSMFYGCSRLKSLNLFNFNTSAVTDMSEMFRDCSGLTELNVSNFNTSKVRFMSGMFSGCSSLTYLNVSNFNTSEVTSMWDMFNGCSALKTIFNTQTWQCEQSLDMFKGCTQLHGAVWYDKRKVDVTMANPTTGYFTKPNPQPYVLQSRAEFTLTFFCDAYRKLRSGTTWDIDEKSNEISWKSTPAWARTDGSPNNVVTKVVFDASFKDFRPTTTNSWFYNLSALTTIEGLENLNTSAVTNMDYMFDGCSSLTSLNLSNLNTSAVTSMSGMFAGCSGLTSLNVSSFNTSAVTSMGRMFDGCSGLTSLNVSNFNTSAVTSMSGMFSGCNGLKELNVSNFNTAAVTNMDYMFYGCSGLTSLNVSSFNTSAVTSMGRMFDGCSSLKELNVSNFNTSAVKNMSWMFYNCSGLKELNVSNFNISAVKDMSGMFSGCSGLKTILNLNTWRCERSQDMFKGCTQLKGAVKYDGSKVNVTMANPTTGYFTDTREAYVLQSEDQHTLTFYYDNNRKLRSGKTWDIDENSSSSKPVWAGTYSTPNKAVTKVVFDASFKDFRPTTTEGWFYHLSELTTIEGLENLNTSKVTDMRYMFEGCSSLTSLNLSNFSTSAVTDMGSMFEGCSSLTSLNLSNFNTSAVTDMSRMFYGCSRLTELNLSNFNTSAVTDMSSIFSGCSVLKELNVSNFNTSAVTDMSAMFKNCSSLTSLNLSNFNTSKVTDMRGMFTNCSGLKAILNLNTWRCERSQDMFKGCTQLNGAVKYDESKLDVTMANPTTGYFTDPNRKIEAYVLQSKDQHTLTFYYDNNRRLRSSFTWDIDQKSSSSKPAWAGTYKSPNNAVTKVVFDASFKDFRPTTTKGWFYRLSELTTIEGLENLNTSAVTDMSTMFSDCSSLTSLNLSNFNTSAVTNMSEMFSYCSGLKTILNPNTWRCEKSQDMFIGCTQLKGAVKYYASKVDVTMANPTIGYFRDSNKKYLDAYVLQSEDQHTLTFYYDNNRKLRSGKIWDIDVKSSSLIPARAGTEAVGKVVFDASFKDFKPTTTEGWFYHLSELTTIEGLENLNTSEVTNMSSMFSGCSSLTELNLSNFNTSAVTNMRYMFYGCSGLTELNVSNFNTSAVKDMSGMFSGCSGLTSLNLSNFNTSKVWNMNSMFSGCSGLKRIFNTQTWRCEQSQDMFKGCTQLNGAVEYDASKVNVWMANPTTGYFTDPNRKLEAYVLQSEYQHTLTFYYDNNRKLRSGKTWDIDQKSSSSKPAWAGTYSTSNKVVTKVVFDASFKDFSPTTTEGWFYNLSTLTTIEGLENLNTSEVTNMSKMFDGCSSLTSLNLSNFNTSSVTNMSEMFSGCSGLTSLNVFKFNTSSVTNMSEMFSGCSGLTSLNVSKFNTSAVTNMSGMFTNCSGLKTILNPHTWRCEKSQDMFKGCTQLNGAVKYDASKLDVTMANPSTGYFRDPNKKYLEAYVLQGEDQHTLTFYYDNNRKLRSGKTWDIDEKSSSSEPVWAGTDKSPNNVVTKVVFDASFKDFRPTTTEGWFYLLPELTTIEGLENLNTSAVTNMEGMFSGCSGLTELNVSNFNTSAVTNMRYMFSGCSGLKTILNPNRWRCEESQNMFEGCTQLKGAVKYDASKLDVRMANPTTGYFSRKLPTAIGRVVFDDNNATQIYNLQGKRVNANQRHLPAGFYIVNGKKVYLNEKP